MNLNKKTRTFKIQSVANGVKTAAISQRHPTIGFVSACRSNSLLSSPPLQRNGHKYRLQGDSPIE